MSRIEKSIVVFLSVVRDLPLRFCSTDMCSILSANLLRFTRLDVVTTKAQLRGFQPLYVNVK